METSPSNYKIKVGAFDWKNSGTDIPVAKVVIFPKYQKGAGYVVPDDIALIKVKRCVPASHYVPVIFFLRRS